LQLLTIALSCNQLQLQLLQIWSTTATQLDLQRLIIGVRYVGPLKSAFELEHCLVTHFVGIFQKTVFCSSACQMSLFCGPLCRIFTTFDSAHFMSVFVLGTKAMLVVGKIHRTVQNTTTRTANSDAVND
jgi:hypothetical protein